MQIAKILGVKLENGFKKVEARNRSTSDIQTWSMSVPRKILFWSLKKNK